MHDRHKPLQRFGMRAGKAAGYAVKAVVGPDAAIGVVHAVGGGVFHAVLPKRFEPGGGRVRPRAIYLERLRLTSRKPAAQDRGVYAPGPIAYLLQMVHRIIDSDHVIERDAPGVQVAVTASKGFVGKDRSDLFARPFLEFVDGVETDGFQRNGFEHNGLLDILVCVVWISASLRRGTVGLRFAPLTLALSPAAGRGNLNRPSLPLLIRLSVASGTFGAALHVIHRALLRVIGRQDDPRRAALRDGIVGDVAQVALGH